MKLYSTCCGAEYIAHTDYDFLPKNFLTKPGEYRRQRHCWAECCNCGKICNLSSVKNNFIRKIKILFRRVSNKFKKKWKLEL